MAQQCADLQQRVETLEQLHEEQTQSSSSAATRLAAANERVAELEARCKRDVETARQSFAEQIDVIQAECNAKVAAKDAELSQLRRIKATPRSHAHEAAHQRAYIAQDPKVGAGCWSRAVDSLPGRHC